MIVNLLLIAVLAICALCDIKRRQLPLKVLLAGLLTGGGCRILQSGLQCGLMANLCCGTLPGAALLAVSLCTRGAVGLGDAVLFMVSGVYLNFWENLLLMLLSLMLAGLWGTGLLVTKKGSRKTTLPLAPFVLAAFAVLEVLKAMCR
jgi:leader peptidase (prepilin peptidase)/N-methyltransferase